jgi:hypothetical protein
LRSLVRDAPGDEAFVLPLAAMVVLSDILVADAEQAEEVLLAEVPSDSFPGFDAHGLDQPKLARLRALLTNEDFDPAWADNVALLASAAGDEGPWVFELPDDIVATLADLPPADEERVAVQWAGSVELGGWSAAQAREVLRELTRCARRAGEANKKLLLWKCL